MLHWFNGLWKRWQRNYSSSLWLSLCDVQVPCLINYFQHTEHWLSSFFLLLHLCEIRLLQCLNRFWQHTRSTINVNSLTGGISQEPQLNKQEGQAYSAYPSIILPTPINKVKIFIFLFLHVQVVLIFKISVEQLVTTIFHCKKSQLSAR